MRDAEWARKRRRTAPLLLFSYHSTRLTAPRPSANVAIRRRSRGGSARGTEKGTRRARTRTRDAHTRTQCQHTHRGLPHPSRRYLCAQCSAVLRGCLSPTVSSVRREAAVRERERERAFYRPFLPARRSVPRYPMCETTLASAAARLERGVTCAGSYIARRAGGTEERMARPL